MHLSWDLKKQLSKTDFRYYRMFEEFFKFSYDSSYPEYYRNILNHNLRNQEKAGKNVQRGANSFSPGL